MMKKHTARKFALSVIASSLLAMPAVVSAAQDVNIHQKPLLGVSEITPSVVLALSVEFPTTYIAYNDNVFKAEDAEKEYLGYFDSNKCYQYVVTTANGTTGGMEDYLHAGDENNNHDNRNWTGWRGDLGDGYFEESGPASTEGKKIGLCSGDLDWSGNMLNWATMSAVDIVRQTLTGGNRAKGVGAGGEGDNNVYRLGDPINSNKAYLRRSMMWRGQEGSDVFPNKTGHDQLGDNNAAATRTRYFAQDVYEGDNALINKLVPKAFTNKIGNVDSPDLVFWNSGTGFYATLYSGGHTNHNRAIQGGARLTNIPENTTKGASTKATWFNVVVEKSEKPTGILQDKADMRTAVMGYLTERRKILGTDTDDESAGDGGVLRASMRKVMDSEVRDNGSFFSNPDNKTNPDAAGNSGVINYVNKFGDNAPYDVRDQVAELYYTAIRYLRNGAWNWDGNDGKQTRLGSAGALPYPLPSTITDLHKDGFPVITSWDDPLRPTGDA